MKVNRRSSISFCSGRALLSFDAAQFIAGASAQLFFAASPGRRRCQDTRFQSKHSSGSVPPSPQDSGCEFSRVLRVGTEALPAMERSLKLERGKFDSVFGSRMRVILGHDCRAQHEAHTQLTSNGAGRAFQSHQSLSPTRRMTCGGGGGFGGSACGSGSCMKLRSMWVRLPPADTLVWWQC